MDSVSSDTPPPVEESEGEQKGGREEKDGEGWERREGCKRGMRGIEVMFRREINKLVVHGKIECGLYGPCVIGYTYKRVRERRRMGEEKDEREGWEGWQRGMAERDGKEGWERGMGKRDGKEGWRGKRTGELVTELGYIVVICQK
jgi:hypothetical protein